MTFHHERRLNRALYHLECLKTEVRAWEEEHPYRTWSDFDVNDLYKLAWVEVLDPPPIELSLIVGDCIHNLRAALDNLALELAIAHNLGEPLPEKVEENSMFPIFFERDKFLAKRKRYIGSIAPAAQTIIEELQPYNRGDGFHRDPLWQLNELSNMDKHRLPHVVLFAQLGSSYFVPDYLDIGDIEPIFDSIEKRAPIARYPTFDKTGSEVYVDVTPRLSVGFGQRVPKVLRGVPVPTRLAAIHTHIANKVLRPLRLYLTRIHVVRASQRYSILPSRG